MSQTDQSFEPRVNGPKEAQKYPSAGEAFDAPIGARKMSADKTYPPCAFLWPNLRGLNRFSSLRGTVTLVALCFVTVLGITLAGYIAVCSRAMQLSNRSFQTRTSQQLAEMGIDEALRAFNKNDWTDWNSSPKLGQGVTGTVKIRIDNYDATQLNSTWYSSANYRPNDLVGYNGIWYRCVVAHSNQAPTSTTSNSGSTSTFWIE